MALTRITKGVIKPNENYQAGIVTATGLDVNGNGDISGDLNVGGILTYEDVTSIDSVGIITAQKGIHVGAGVSAVGVGTFSGLDISGDIDVDGHTNLDNVSIAGVTTTTGDLTVGSGGENSALGVRVNSAYAQIKLPDGQTGANRKGNLSFGDNDDFRIVHDGYHNYITSGAGDIYISTPSANPVNIYNNRVHVNVDLTLIDTATDSSAGPEFKLFRNSSSPADADYLGQIKFAGESDTGVERNYAKITGKILDASNGTEDGIIEFAHIKAGSQTITGRFRSDSLQLLNGTNFSVAGDSTFTGDIDVDGHTNLDNVSVAGVSTFSGNILPDTDSSHNIGSNGVRFANIYGDALYGVIQNTTHTNITRVGTLSQLAVSGTANPLNVTHTSANCVNLNRGGKSIAIDVNYGGSNTHSLINLSSGMDLRFKLGGTDKIVFKSAGHIEPITDSQINLGSNSVRFANAYVDTYYGDGSNLTGITGTTINNNANNRVITGSGTANTLEAESNLTFTGSNLTVTNSSGAAELTLTTPNNTDGGIYFRTGSTNAGAVSYLHTTNTTDKMNFRVGSTTKFIIHTSGFAELSGAADVRLTLGNAGTAGTNNANWIRGVNNNLYYNAATSDHLWEIGGAEHMRLNNSGNLYLRSESANYVVLGNSGDATSNNVTNSMNWIRGNQTHLQYNSNGGMHAWEISGSEKMRLHSNGRLTIGDPNGNNTASAALHVIGDQAGTDTAFQVGGDGSARYFRINELSSQSNFDKVVMSFYDNTLHNFIEMQNTYAGAADMGGNIRWIGHGGGETGKISVYNRDANSSSNSVMELRASYITKPSHPYFDVARSSGTVSATNVVQYNNVYINNGNHYNSSNGRFTAPVDGHYQFWFGHIKQDTNSVVRAKWRKNGSGYLHGNRELRMDDGGPRYGDNAAITIITYLNKNDYVEVVVTAGTIYGTAPEYGYACGTLLG